MKIMVNNEYKIELNNVFFFMWNKTKTYEFNFNDNKTKNVIDRIKSIERFIFDFSKNTIKFWQ
jgi:hypothetical protein